MHKGALRFAAKTVHLPSSRATEASFGQTLTTVKLNPHGIGRSHLSPVRQATLPHKRRRSLRTPCQTRWGQLRLSGSAPQSFEAPRNVSRNAPRVETFAMNIAAPRNLKPLIETRGRSPGVETKLEGGALPPPCGPCRRPDLAPPANCSSCILGSCGSADSLTCP